MRAKCGIAALLALSAAGCVVVSENSAESDWVRAEVRTAISEALSHNGPALVDVNVNPDEPPLPGKVEYQQAKKFTEAFLRGQPRKATIATTLFRDKIEQLKG